jgi:hypothetical protein
LDGILDRNNEPETIIEWEGHYLEILERMMGPRKQTNAPRQGGYLPQKGYLGILLILETVIQLDHQPTWLDRNGASDQQYYKEKSRMV